MANSFYYIDGGSTTNTLYVAGTSTDRFVVRGSEFGWGWPPRAPYVESIPGRYADIYRATAFQPRTYGFTLHLKGTSASDLDTLCGTIEDYMNADKGAGQVKRITNAGTTLYLECIPLAPEWFDRRGYHAEVRLTWLAAFPWWRSESESTSSDNFNNASNVTKASNNAGDIATWPRVVITGVVDDPKFTLIDGTFIDVSKTTSNADDTITIDWRPWGSYPKTAYFRLNGTGTRTYLSYTSTSEWGTQATGTNNIVAVCDAGTCGFVINWYNYYGSLY